MRVRWVLPRAWALALAALLLGPALGPGFVLSYDMVWVPELALRPDFLGTGTGLPRGVPSDAVVAVLDELVPGMILQKLVLLGLLVAAGWGAVHLAPAGSLAGQLVAVSVYLWNPFVAERLAIGHWPVLLAYAVLPWILTADRDGATSRLPTRMWVLVPLGSLSASAGVATAVALVASQLRRGDPWRGVVVTALLAAANAPWVVSGLLHAGASTTGGEAVRFFGLAGVGDVPAGLVALGLGGIWNVEVVLPSRTTGTVVVSLVVLGTLAALGWHGWRRRLDAKALLICWVVGWGLAVLTWAVPGATAWVMERVPGVAVLRDGARMLLLCAPLLASLVAYGAAALLRRAPARLAAVALGSAVVLTPVALLPDAGWGLSGRLAAVDYPDDYGEARAALQERQNEGVGGDALLLPFTSYRAPEWNRDRKVLDPLGRYLPADYVANDELSVSGTVLAGEDPRARAVTWALREPTPQDRARELGVLGIRWIVAAREAPGEVPQVAGTELVSTPLVEVVEVSDVRERTAPAAWQVAMGVAWMAFLTPVLGALCLYACRAFSRVWYNRPAGTVTRGSTGRR